MYLMIKRAMDVLIASTAIVILSPVFLATIAILKFTGEGEVFYGQERVGFRNSRFKLLKFATMVKNSPNIGTGTITTKNDPRVLPFGRFLRKTKINELPQIINVLVGDMSIVGPRPQTVECFEYYSDDIQSKIYQARPGLTGVGSVIFRDEEEIMARSEKSLADCYREDIMPEKGRAEIWYMKNQSFLLDLKLILLTAIVLLQPESPILNKWLPNNF